VELPYPVVPARRTRVQSSLINDLSDAIKEREKPKRLLTAIRSYATKVQYKRASLRVEDPVQAKLLDGTHHRST
jgi:hypothetical protein